MTMANSPVSDVTIDAALDRPGGAYLYQESIWIVVTIRNGRAAPQPIPYLLTHSIVLELRDGAGEVHRVERQFKSPPPLLRMPEPEVALAPAESVTYRVLLDPLLGTLAPGRYGVRLLVAGGPLPFTTAWLPFSVAATRPATARAAASSASNATETRAVWRDDGTSPPQIVFQARTMVGRSMPATTIRLGEADPASEPALAITPGDQSRIPAWAAWVAGNNLVLARQYGETVDVHRHALPAGRFQVINPFTFAERPDGSGTRLHGALLDSDTGRLMEFSGDGSQVVLSALTPPAAGRVEAVAVAPIDEGRLAAIVARRVGDRVHLEGWIFATAGPAAPTSIGELGLGIDGVAAVYEPREHGGGELIRWAAWQRSAGTPVTRVVEGAWAPTGASAQDPGTPTRIVPSTADSSRCDGAFDERRRLWLWCTERAGAKVFGPEHESGTPIALPLGARPQALVFRRGTLPQLLLIDPANGFDLIRVD
jgi:hypothetical protein